ncbi:MAG: preprotein translocase subunit SecG [bacterium]
MYGFLMVLFIILCVVLGFFILLQQGKGDMGLGALGGGSQMLFGGSGGQEFFQRTTWILGSIFILGSLGLAILKSKETRQSRLGDFVATQKVQKEQSLPTTQNAQAVQEAQDIKDELIQKKQAETQVPVEPAVNTESKKTEENKAPEASEKK